MWRNPVRGRAYRTLVRWIDETYHLSLRDCIFKRINEDGLTHSALARELGIDRQRLYTYARANGVELTTKPVAIDLWAEMGLNADSGSPSATGTDG